MRGQNSAPPALPESAPPAEPQTQPQQETRGGGPPAWAGGGGHGEQTPAAETSPALGVDWRPLALIGGALTLALILLAAGWYGLQKSQRPR